jgi:bacteriocin biosynthesis cyclodehydratase domain-containing protein
MTVGYLELHGICGPLFVPGRTGCYACQDAGAPERHDGIKAAPLVGEINARQQSASFGPLNGMVASMAAKEALLWLGGVQSGLPTLGSAVLLDERTLETTRRPWPHNDQCPVCRGVRPEGDLS